MGRCFYQDIAPTIRTRTDGANMDFIMEEVKIIKEGNYSPSGHNASSIVSTQGIAPAVMENHGTVTAIREPKVINPLKGQSDNGWHFEQQVYDAEGIARAVKAGEGSGNIPKVIEVGRVNEGKHQQDFVQHEEGICRCICTGHHASTPHLLKTMVSEPISVAMRGRNPNNPSERGKSNGNYKQRLEMNESGVANTITSVQKDSMVAEPMCVEDFYANRDVRIYTDYAPSCRAERSGLKVVEPRVEQVGNIYPDTDTFKNRTMGRVYSNEGLSPTINCCGGGDREPKVVETRYRIRKLTPRECFRLMDVDDADIDKIQATGISNSQQYKLAGNSIVVNVLYHLFRKMFVETENESQQLTLF